MDRAVAIINVDHCVIGDILRPFATPVLKEVLVEAMRGVPSALELGKSSYESLAAWLARGKQTRDLRLEDYVGTPHGASDHAAFAYFAGVPALFFAFR